MKRILVFFILVIPAVAQSNRGELRLAVTDQAGLAVRTTVQIISEANQYRNSLATTDEGHFGYSAYPMEYINSQSSNNRALLRQRNSLTSIPRYRLITQ